MAVISIYGSPKNLGVDIVEKITQFFSKFLLKRLHDKVIIDIHFLDGHLLKTGNYADMTWTDEDSRVPREFEISIDSNMSRRRTIKSIAHEMVHVKQYAKNELKDLSKCVSKRWAGKIYEHDKVEYVEQPWEWEAHFKEDYLYNLWKEHTKGEKEY